MKSTHIIHLAWTFLLCLSSLFFMSADMAYICAFLLAVILACLSLIPVSRWILGAGCLLFSLAAIGWEGFLCFFPVVVYCLILAHFRQLFIPCVFAAVSSVILHGETCGFPLWLTMLGASAAIFLASSAEKNSALKEALRRTRDDSVERDLLLTEKQKKLLEKQDYEIYAATLAERNRIAREIHDNVGHLLSRSILLTGALRAVNQEETLSDSLKALDESLNQAMDSIRASVHDLKDEAVDLESALRLLVDDFTFCPVNFCFDCGKTVPRDVKYSFISITKEALANVIRHSDASLVTLTVREHPGMYQLYIEDNGSSSGDTGSGGIGLVNMKERVDALHGTFHVTAESGFHIRIMIPKGETQ